MAARSHPNESLSDVVMRAYWHEEPVSAVECLRIARERGPTFSAEDLERLEAASGEIPD
jgi:hypothetical protein